MKPQSWDHVASWYDTLVGGKGQYFHQHVIFPKVLELLELQPDQKVLDLACGQGAFCRELSKKNVDVIGVDASFKLIESAKKYPGQSRVSYLVDDVRTLTKFTETVDRVVSILALQNIDPIDGVIERVRTLLQPGGSFITVILHPSFRSPRITGWGEDEGRKLQFRRVDRYITPMKIPIEMHPGKQHGQITWTYHRPLQDYINLAGNNGLAVDHIEELVSDKVSEGRNAKMENLARQEFPMFLLIRWKKLS